ncbi:MAG: AmmeMemoRadiSam system protein B [Nitrososphaerales archaeon]
MEVRMPAVAGQFYESDPTKLKESIEECFLHPLGPQKIPPAPRSDEEVIGLISPHAGYMYSGPIAAHGYYYASALPNPELVVIMGPNHWGLGSGVATVSGGIWRTPLGALEVSSEDAKTLVKFSGIVDFNAESHKREHSIEVQLPFLQYIFNSQFKILPISMLFQDKETSTEVGHALAKIVRGRRCIIIASSDLTHYESHKQASTKDSEFIKAALTLDVSKLYNVLQRLDVSACGYGPIAALITAVNELNLRKAELLKYATSGDITGDKSSVVGYASVKFSK